MRHSWRNARSTPSITALNPFASTRPPHHYTLFTSATLRELVISQRRKSYTRTYKPTRFLLPNLKTLCLEAPNLYFTSDVQGKELFFGLPELEKLFLIKFPVSGLVLKAPKLRVLEIIDSCCLIEEIAAPLLTSFRYEGGFPLECSIMNVPMLEQVYLDIYGLAYHPECSIVLEKDGGQIEQSPPFPNLKCLKAVKASNKISTVLESAINYLTRGTLYFESLLMIEFPHDVVVVQQNSDDQAYYDDLYYEGDSTQSSQVSN
ncbi:hypothetical protein SASPL_150147 [Salvia splendens]|uniref:FBD domain-containing protein n=1 Tax=Salvia splendens TaxID=180675 RepID=A0A8X8W621_SALSN|nr:hypothetical protein SASPL_150147 [Salvia splendens]